MSPANDSFNCLPSANFSGTVSLSANFLLPFSLTVVVAEFIIPLNLLASAFVLALLNTFCVKFA